MACRAPEDRYDLSLGHSFLKMIEPLLAEPRRLPQEQQQSHDRHRRRRGDPPPQSVRPRCHVHAFVKVRTAEQERRMSHFF